ncbi:hypothetical protein F0562_018037 [Nyssa sinensis]|uniref:Uncharacterized protein n=1 Tax=Nyssa sinensis TaxID=561372 RepID=A0A5J4ZB98_9ASTE|nr:hypothetical protein F0562_018037 [Nyssa sinensis]
MATGGNGSTHSGDEDHGMQALWAAVQTQEQQRERIERAVEEIRQAITGLGFGGNRNHDYDGVRVDEATLHTVFTLSDAVNLAYKLEMQLARHARSQAPNQQYTESSHAAIDNGRPVIVQTSQPPQRAVSRDSWKVIAAKPEWQLLKKIPSFNLEICDFAALGNILFWL